VLVTSSFAVESFGGALVVAAVDQVAGGNDEVQVGAMDESGATLWSATVQTDGTVEGALSLRAAPDGEGCDEAAGRCLPGTCASAGGACKSDHDCCSQVCDTGAGVCK
jgi:hypothetical protein